MQSLVVLMPSVSHIHIEVGHIRENGGIARICQAVRNVGTAAHCAPCVHHRKAWCHGGIVAVGVVEAHFLPAASLDALLSEVLGDTANEIFAHFVGIFQTFCLHQGLNVGRSVPRAFWHLITTKMHDVEFQTCIFPHLLKFVNYLIYKVEHALMRHVEHIVVIRLC